MPQQTVYIKIARMVARKAVIGVLFIVVVCCGTGVVGKLLPGGFIPAEDMGYFMVNVQLRMRPPSSGLMR